MPHGKSRPLAAPFFNQDALWKHGIAYAGNAPVPINTHENRQKPPVLGNKDSRRDHKTPFHQTNPKELIMTTTHQTQSRKSSPAVSGSAEEMGSIFKDVLNDEMKKEFAIHLGPAFEGLANALKLANENVVLAHKEAKEAKDNLNVVGEAVGKAAGAAVDAQNAARAAEAAANEAAKVAQEAANAAKEGPKKTNEEANQVWSWSNVKGDLRQAGVIGGVAVVLGAATWGFTAIFGSDSAAPAPTVRKAA